jgi:peptide/nickel transport system permease protein
MPETALLLGAGAVVALAIGVPLGIAFAAGPMRRAAAPLIQIVAAAPVFCAALALAFVAQKFLHFPAGVGDPASTSQVAINPANPLAALKALGLPVLTVGLAGAAFIQLLLRNAAGSIADTPWRTGLRQMGLPAGEIDRVYVMPEVVSGVFKNLGEFALVLLSAAAVAEWVFDRPGAAVLFVKSIALADWGMAALVLFAFAAIKLVADFFGALFAEALAAESSEP